MKVDQRCSQIIEMTNTYMMISDSIKEREISYWSIIPSTLDPAKREEPPFHGLPLPTLAEACCSYMPAKRSPLRTDCNQLEQLGIVSKPLQKAPVACSPAACLDDASSAASPPNIKFDTSTVANEPFLIPHRALSSKEDLVAFGVRDSECLRADHLISVAHQEPGLATSNNDAEVPLPKVEVPCDYSSSVTFNDSFRSAQETIDTTSALTWSIPEVYQVGCATHSRDISHDELAYPAPFVCSATAHSCNDDLSGTFDQLISMPDHSPDDSFQPSHDGWSDIPSPLAGDSSTFAPSHHPLPPPFRPQLSPTNGHGVIEIGGALRESPTRGSDAKNKLLIQYKQQGFSYKTIKEVCNFAEAESTLRGRYRTLTKPKHSRIQLLCEAVIRLGHGRQVSQCPYLFDYQSRNPALAQPPKVSWKQVALYIHENGGSYLFGNATCKKKWCEVHDVKC
ncbi:hypothetical protein ASPACDRAFT_1857528 [Aspergillus aculeatus ATCC 16872]|uniref:Uncharacterized protein n=1 Tax=Aspergillus aculeatus (strain ATCC 16872 / CBS 172.66 / WB 5094) TaxID=690307 RepID=A0A1L9WPY1_ASPA1|nr:uncharacterized protein ASPACDRAFT_1857528 [Aspergillus aculeatus ATCC 16872]OJJ98200.1 hypothetical protein ASPACDRAFT_1857528 [Aspergillus aculeatus ATCC 16872]